VGPPQPAAAAALGHARAGAWASERLRAVTRGARKRLQDVAARAWHVGPRPRRLGERRGAGRVGARIGG
jgi:hypothetical protein